MLAFADDEDCVELKQSGELVQAEKMVSKTEKVSDAGVTYGDWGVWSEWQDTAVSSSDTRQVETR